MGLVNDWAMLARHLRITVIGAGRAGRYLSARRPARQRGADCGPVRGGAINAGCDACRV
ncbi:hypothetical protein ACVXG9_28965 [Escherichia coli]